MEEECSVLGRAGARAGWRGGHGVAEGRARGVPARADRTAAEHTPRPWSAAASDLHERVCARQRAVAGAGCGASAARTARPTRRGADEEGSVGPGGAGAGASRHREAAARARGAARAAASKWQQSAFAPRGDLREAIRADEGGGGPANTPSRNATAPSFPPAAAARLGPSARRSEAPKEELPGDADRPGEPTLRTAGRGPSSTVSGLSRAAEGRPRMPERRPEPVLGHPLTEALQGLPVAPPAALRRREPPIERYRP